MFVGENDPYHALTSASPRLPFDFSSRFNESQGLKKLRETPQIHR